MKRNELTYLPQEGESFSINGEKGVEGEKNHFFREKEGREGIKWQG